MMAAGTAAMNGHSVLLMEKMEKAGRKIRITGKGRCNLTNARPAEEFLEKVRTNQEFFSVAFAEFNNRATIRFFERIGVKLETERGERVFPKSGKAWDIANALVDFCEDKGVKIAYKTEVTAIETVGGRICGVRYRNARGFERREEAQYVIVATGGVSYPSTASAPIANPTCDLAPTEGVPQRPVAQERRRKAIYRQRVGAGGVWRAWILGARHRGSCGTTPKP